MPPKPLPPPPPPPLSLKSITQGLCPRLHPPRDRHHQKRRLAPQAAQAADGRLLPAGQGLQRGPRRFGFVHDRPRRQLRLVARRPAQVDRLGLQAGRVRARVHAGLDLPHLGADDPGRLRPERVLRGGAVDRGVAVRRRRGDGRRQGLGPERLGRVQRDLRSRLHRVGAAHRALGDAADLPVRLCEDGHGRGLKKKEEK